MSLKQRFVQLKLLLITLVVLNAHFFIVPAVNSATELAVRSLTEGQLLPAYKVAYKRESIFGALNAALTIAAAVVGVWRIGAKSTAHG